jgi:thioredoxin reductase
MSQYLVDRILAEKNITIKVDVNPTIMNDRGITCDDGATYPCDYSFFCIGGRPSIDFLPSSAKMDEQGHLYVNEKMEIKSMPDSGAYAIGDCVNGVRRHSIGTCCGHAATATAYLHEYLRRFKSGKA